MLRPHRVGPHSSAQVFRSNAGAKAPELRAKTARPRSSVACRPNCRSRLARFLKKQALPPLRSRRRGHHPQITYRQAMDVGGAPRCRSGKGPCDRVGRVENGVAMKSSRIALTVRGTGSAGPPSPLWKAARRRVAAPARTVIRVSAGVAHMRTIWTVLIAVLLGSAMGACSKCEIPDLLPKMCKTGASGT